MATVIHGAGPAGQRSPGLDLAIAGYLTENPPAGGGGAQATVFFGSDAATTRPDNDAPVIWVGEPNVTPTNAIENFDLVVTFEGATPPPAPTPPDSAPALSMTVVSGSAIDGTITPLLDATGYEWVREDGTQTGDPTTGVPVDIAAQTTFSAEGLALASTHTFWARGYNLDGNGPWSAPQVATTSSTNAVTVLTDDFNRADVGANYDSLYYTSTAPLTILEGQLRNTSGSAVRGLLVAEAVGVSTTNQWIQAVATDLTSTTQQGYIYLFARSTDTGRATGYEAWLNKLGTWSLRRLGDPGGAGIEATGSVELAGGSVTYSLPHTVRLEAFGSNIRFYIDEVEVASVTDATWATGKVGIGLYKDTARADDLSAGNL